MSQERAPDEFWRKFKLYRWLVGGKWAQTDGVWYHMSRLERHRNELSDSDFFSELGHGFHFTYLGVQKREDYEYETDSRGQRFTERQTQEDANYILYTGCGCGHACMHDKMIEVTPTPKPHIRGTKRIYRLR